MCHVRHARTAALPADVARLSVFALAAALIARGLHAEDVSAHPPLSHHCGKEREDGAGAQKQDMSPHSIEQQQPTAVGGGSCTETAA